MGVIKGAINAVADPRLFFLLACLALVVMVYFITYLDRVLLSNAMPVIQKQFGFSLSTLGVILGCYNWGYALFQIPGGWFGDRVGPRIALASVVIWWSVFTFITGFSMSVTMLMVCLFLIGMGEAGAWPCVARAAMLGACLGVVYGVADVAEDMKLRSILIHAEQITGSPEPSGRHVSEPRDYRSSLMQPADAAQVDAANALTRIKLVMLCASGIGLVAFGVLFLADRLLGAISGGPRSGGSAANQQPRSVNDGVPG